LKKDKVNKQAICELCEPVFYITTTNGTNKLANHLGSIHNIFKPLDRVKEDNKGIKKFKVHFANQQAAEAQLAIFVADCHIPLNIVEKDSFIDLLKLFQPSFVMPSGASLRAQIHHQSQLVKDKIKSLIHNQSPLSGLLRRPLEVQSPRLLCCCHSSVKMFYLVVNKKQLSRVPAWTEDQWHLLEKLMDVFGPSAHTLDRLQGQKFVTQSSILLELLMLEKNNNAMLAELEDEDYTNDHINSFLHESSQNSNLL
jgi:hypothetical protein